MVVKQMTGPISRWRLAHGLAAAVACTPPPVLAARPTLFAVSRSEPNVGQKPGAKQGVDPAQEINTATDVELEVSVSQQIVEATELQRWIHDEGRRVLDDLPDDTKRRGSLHVEIGGELYDYQVTISVLRDGAPMGFPSTWQCECSNEELLEKLRAELAERAGVLEVEEEPAPPPEPVLEVPVAPVKIDRAPRRARLGPAGVAGVTLMALGAAGVGVGVVFMAVHQVSPSKAEGANYRAPDLLPPGAVLVGSSLSMVVLGFAMHLFRDRTPHHRRARVAAVAPTMNGAGQLSLTVKGRF